MSNKSNVMQARDIQRMSVGQTIARIFGKTGTYVFLIIMALIVLFPFYWMIISSLKTVEEYQRTFPTFFPETIKWANYANAWGTAKLGQLFMNTLFVGVVSTLLSLVITVLSAFAFARLEFKGKETLFAGLLRFLFFLL